jgi:hypothetical protein
MPLKFFYGHFLTFTDTVFESLSREAQMLLVLSTNTRYMISVVQIQKQKEIHHSGSNCDPTP